MITPPTLVSSSPIRLKTLIHGAAQSRSTMMAPTPAWREYAKNRCSLAGRVPVLLAGHKQLQPYGASGAIGHVFTLYTTWDANMIYHAPTNTKKLTIDIWMWTPAS